MSSATTTSTTDRDREALRARYRQERDKRLRSDGINQYIEPSGKYAHLLEDPHTPKVDRAPIFRDVTVAFIGGGFAGLCAGVRLKQAGIDDIMIIEGAGDFGGVWYWNRYPGAMCDTAAMIYLPLLEETGTAPSKKYVFGPEILAHARRIATTFDLYPNGLFSTHVTRMDWNEEASRWMIQTDRGDVIRARFVGMGTGLIHRPKLPGIPGIFDYEGHAFHTSRWDYEYTGGTPEGAPMEKLKDKRVGVIGTGATGVQCIGPLARDAKELFVFQRTPSSVDVRNNQELDTEWYQSLEPGWQKKWLVNFATLQSGGFADEDYVQDGWTDISKRYRDRAIAYASEDGAEFNVQLLQRAIEDADDEKMNDIRARVDSIVTDKETAENLKAWYRQLCKRPCFHDDYLPSFNLPSVHLVDTDGKGVEGMDATGVWVNGQHYEVDCLVFASGFEFGTELVRRCGFETYGRNHVSLSERWADGMQSMHGMHVHGFPNLFITSVWQGGAFINNITHNLSESADTFASVIRHALDVDAVEVEVAPDAEQEWVKLIAGGRSSGSALSNPDCTPGYYNNEGQPMGQRERLNFGSYPEGPVAFFNFIEQWRTSGDFKGLEFRTSGSLSASR